MKTQTTARVKQFNEFEPVKGFHINGKACLGEHRMNFYFSIFAIIYLHSVMVPKLSEDKYGSEIMFVDRLIILPHKQQLNFSRKLART